MGRVSVVVADAISVAVGVAPCTAARLRAVTALGFEPRPRLYAPLRVVSANASQFVKCAFICAHL